MLRNSPAAREKSCQGKNEAGLKNLFFKAQPSGFYRFFGGSTHVWQKARTWWVLDFYGFHLL